MLSGDFTTNATGTSPASSSGTLNETEKHEKIQMSEALLAIGARYEDPLGSVASKLEEKRSTSLLCMISGGLGYNIEIECKEVILKNIFKNTNNYLMIKEENESCCFNLYMKNARTFTYSCSSNSVIVWYNAFMFGSMKSVLHYPIQCGE